MGLSILLCIFIVIFAVLTFNYELIGLLAIELIAIAFVPLNLCLHWRLLYIHKFKTARVLDKTKI